MNGVSTVTMGERISAAINNNLEREGIIFPGGVIRKLMANIRIRLHNCVRSGCDGSGDMLEIL
jgi:hypothetical protein